MTTLECEQLGFAPEFRPDLSPQEMLSLGVFGGAYFVGENIDEYPLAWFAGIPSAEEKPEKELNYFGVNASQTREEWIRKGWISEHDPLGWFQWYCRYYLGRRLPEEDARQIKRWKNMVRHVAQVRYSCRIGDFTCHTKQRQALLHWAYDSRRI